jgi:hypothetical protein
MIKLLYIAIYSPIVFIVAQMTPSEPLALEQWAAFALWIVVMLLVATIGAIAFKSVWLRDGFAGINKILEDHEALKFLASIMSFIFLEVFVALFATEFSGRYPHPSYQYYLTFSGCVGTGGYAIADKLMKITKMKNNGDDTSHS